MLTPDQAKTMLSLQHSMNTKVDPDWMRARYPYLRAVAIEGAEAIVKDLESQATCSVQLESMRLGLCHCA